MLPPRTKRYIRSQLPDRYPLYYEGGDPDYAEGWREPGYPIEYRSTNEDFGNPSSTVVYLEATVQGQLRGDDTSLNRLIRREFGTDEHPQDLVEHKGERLFDEWQFTVADSGQEHDVGARDRVDACTHMLDLYFRSESATDDLYHLPSEVKDEPGIIPVKPLRVDGGSDTSGMVDDRKVKQYSFTVRFDYTLTWPVVTRAVEAMSGSHGGPGEEFLASIKDHFGVSAFGDEAFGGE